MKCQRKLALKNVIYIVVLCSFLSSFAKAEEYIKAEIYYHNWGLDVRSRMSPDDVKSRFLTKLEIRDKSLISHFVKELPIDEMKEQEIDITQEDVRLVIDLTRVNGEVDTYLASRFLFFESTGKLSFKLPIEFSEEFELGYTFAGRSN